MNLLNEINSIFHNDNIIFNERVKIVESSFDVEIINIPLYNDIISILNIMPERDTLKISLISHSEDVLLISKNNLSSQANYNKYLSGLDNDDIIHINITIEKEIVENIFSIYTFSSFANDLLNKSISQVMAIFSDLLKRKEYLIFDLFEEQCIFTTGTMTFVPTDKSINRNHLLRSSRLNSCKETSYFFNVNNYELLPDDFSIEINFENNPFTELFDKITTILSMVYVSSSSSIENTDLKVQISGQRNVDFCYKIEDIKINREFFKVYKWIYTDGNSIDKSIIARNIISMHCRYTDLIDTDEKTFSSIQSNYNLYIKNNVNQYIELKNKLAEFICNVIAKTGDHATKLLGNFKSNLIAILGFLFTVVLANIVSEQPLQNIFTRDITAIIELVLFGSVAYLVISIMETSYKLKMTKGSYYSLKENYKSILSEIDLKEVFKDDMLIIDASKSVKSGTIIYGTIWIVFIIISLIVVEYLSSSPVIWPIIKALL